MRPRATNALTRQFTRLEEEIGKRIESANLASDLIMVVMNQAATLGLARAFAAFRLPRDQQVPVCSKAR